MKRAFTLAEILLAAGLSLLLLTALVPALLYQSRSGVRSLYQSSLQQRVAMIVRGWDEEVRAARSDSFFFSQGPQRIASFQPVNLQADRPGTEFSPELHVWTWESTSRRLYRGQVTNLSFSATTPLRLTPADLLTLTPSRVLLSGGVEHFELSRQSNGLVRLKFEIVEAQSDGIKNRLALERLSQFHVR